MAVKHANGNSSRKQQTRAADRDDQYQDDQDDQSNQDEQDESTEQDDGHDQGEPGSRDADSRKRPGNRTPRFTAPEQAYVDRLVGEARKKAREAEKRRVLEKSGARDLDELYDLVYEAQERRSRDHDTVQDLQTQVTELKRNLQETQQAREKLSHDRLHALRLAEIRMRAARMNFVSPDDPVKFLGDLERFEVGDDSSVSGVQEALEQLASERPYLLAQERQAAERPDSSENEQQQPEQPAPQAQAPAQAQQPEQSSQQQTQTAQQPTGQQQSVAQPSPSQNGQNGHQPAQQPESYPYDRQAQAEQGHRDHEASVLTGQQQAGGQNGQHQTTNGSQQPDIPPTPAGVGVDDARVSQQQNDNEARRRMQRMVRSSF